MILTERLQIREFTIEDAERMTKYRSKETVFKYQSWTYYSYAHAIERIRHCLQHPFQGEKGNYQLAVALREENIVIGDFFIDVQTSNTIVLGYTFDDSYWSLGYASESLQALLQYLREHYHFKFVICYVYEGNLRSIRLLEKNGFIKFEHSPYMGDMGFKKILG